MSGENENLLTTMLGADLKLHMIQTEFCGHLSVFVQGDLEKLREGNSVFLTVHDIGSNHNSWVSFTKNEVMNGVTEKSLFLHVCAPGQETGAEDLPDNYTFPTMQELGEGLVTVLDILRVPRVICLGAGAGANIMTRFVLKNPNRCHGAICIQPTASVATFREQFKEKLNAMKPGASFDTDQFMVFHKFGHSVDKFADIQEALKEFKNKLHRDINKKNLKLYVDAFMKRTDISEDIAKSLTTEMLILVGARYPMVKATEAMYKQAPMKSTSILKLEDVGDVLDEAPEKAQEAMLLFCQGLGLLPAVQSNRSSREGSRRSSTASTPGGNRSRKTSMSMQEADIPNIRRLSLTSA